MEGVGVSNCAKMIRDAGMNISINVQDGDAVSKQKIEASLMDGLFIPKSFKCIRIECIDNIEYIRVYLRTFM
jgi:hypothetical protein